MRETKIPKWDFFKPYLINQERDEGFELYVIYENVRLMIHLKDLKRANGTQFIFGFQFTFSSPIR